MIRLKNFKWLKRAAARLPANQCSRMRWAPRLHEAIEPDDQRELAIRSLKRKLAGRQAWLEVPFPYDESNPVVRKLTQEIRELRSQYGLHDIDLSAEDLVAVSRDTITDHRLLLREWETLGHDADARRELAEQIAAAERLLAERLKDV